MEQNWAAEHLQVIRTLMERSAVYRRALAPLMTFAGVVGTFAALLAWQLKIEGERAFVSYWSAVSILTLTGAFLLVRRQAISAGEVVWSSPTRRVSQALLPGLFLGAIAGVVVWLHGGMVWLPPVWIGLYGCALHAAGFFMPRGIRLFGWCSVVLAAVISVAEVSGTFHCAPNLTMGLFFGVLHLAYGVYLYFTEQRRITL
jgi:hypothetical protein